MWRDIDRDHDVRWCCCAATGGVFSAGGDLGMVETMATDWETRAGVWKEASDLVYNVINCSKPIVRGHRRPGRRRRAGGRPAVRHHRRRAARARIIDGHTRLGVAAGDHSAIVWPLLCGMAKAKYYLLLCETLTGEEAERIGLVSLCVDDDKVVETALGVGEKLAACAPAAMRWTKHALNNWLRMAGPTFDASLALEFLGFGGPEVREGLEACARSARRAFDPESPL